MHRQTRLTIISVSYKSKDLLNANYKLVKALNPHASFDWIVVQNTPTSDSDEDLSMNDPRFLMIKGPALTPREQESSFYRSIHHAKALNLALSYTAADLILTLDPDCFILMPNWIELVMQYIQEKKLIFFGTPYHPKYTTHYRGFPNVICMFIHRQLMQEHNYFSLDFTPDFEGRKLWNREICAAIDWHSKSIAHFIAFFSASSRHFPLRKRDLFLIVKKIFNNRSISLKIKEKFDHYLPQWNVEKCRDTGYKIYRAYRCLLKHETLQIFASDNRSRQVKLVESLMPERYRSFTRQTKNIKKDGSPLFDAFGEFGEQFFWEGQLFGFHLKGVMDHVPKEIKLQLREKILNTVEDFIENLAQRI